MDKRIGLKLFIIMIVFSVTITTIVSISDFIRLRAQAIENNEFQIEQTEYTIAYSLSTIEKAYYYFDQETAQRMERYTNQIIDRYLDNPHFETWDFQDLKEQFDGMDIYILDEDNEIIYSSFINDIGLNFNDCCGKLARTLDERRESGEFYHDGMDIEQQTGSVKKFSYKATPDKKYIIELGYNLEGGPIFSEFNFLQVADELVKHYSSVKGINVLNIGGHSLGIPVDDYHLPPENRASFERTLASGEVSEIDALYNGEMHKYRYVRYDSELDQGTTQYKVIEIVYDDSIFQAVLSKLQSTFLYQFILTFIVAGIISIILARLISRPMHLAFHDSLTGLRNRAAFDEYLSEDLSKKSEQTAFLMIDIDNFKRVNDRLGHDEGDYLLSQVAHCIRINTRTNDMTFRYGGDEFIIVMENTTKDEAELMAKNLIRQIAETIRNKEEIQDLNVSASIGISMSPEDGNDLHVLYKKADAALYVSKGLGKNQYQFYNDESIINK